MNLGIGSKEDEDEKLGRVKVRLRAMLTNTIIMKIIDDFRCCPVREHLLPPPKVPRICCQKLSQHLGRKVKVS